MSNSTMSFKEGFLSFYLPGILVFIGFVAAGTCISTGPFIPVGLSGIVSLAVLVCAAVLLIKRHYRIQDLKCSMEANEHRIESIVKKNNSELARKDGIISEFKETVMALQNRIGELEHEIASEKAAKKVKEEVKKETVEEESKPAKKTTKKQK